MKTLAASIGIGLGLSLLALAACSSDSGGGGAATPDGGAPGTNPAPVLPLDEGGTVPGSIVLPEGNWVNATNAQHYKVYPNRDAALAWFEEARKRNPTTANDKPVASSDPRYADADKEVAEIWKAYAALFQRDTKDIPAPIVLLAESPNPGAYATYDDALKQAPNVFIILTPTLPLGQVALRGVIAHELAHHVLKHKFPGNADKIEVWYDATKTSKHGFGFEQSSDATIKATGFKYTAYALATGDYPVKEWNGWNRPEADIEYYRGLIHSQAKAKTAGPCTDAESARNALIDFAFPLIDRGTNTFVATPAQLTQLDTLSKTAVDKETTCASAVTGKFFDIVAADAQSTEAAVRASATAPEIAANDAATNAYDAIARLTKAYDEYLVSVDLKPIRYYSFEEQADDVSALVLLAMQLDGHGMAEYLKGTLDPAGKTKCASLVAAGEPPYGALSDPHHSNCWRVWHANKLIDYIKMP